MKLSSMLNRIIYTLRAQVFLQFFIVYLRYLIGGAFVIAVFGMGKLGLNSELLAQEKINNSLVNFPAFASFVNAPIYWNFIGWSQLLAGCLLITQRYARIGALLFLPIITNIFVLTFAYQFKGTVYITALMLLANLLLVAWEWPFLSGLFLSGQQAVNINVVESKVEHKAFWTYLGILLFVFLVLSSLFIPNILLQLAGAFFIGLAGFTVFLLFSKLR